MNDDTPRNCPSPDQLAELLTEHIAPPDREHLEEHVGDCRHCQNQLEEMAANETEWQYWEKRLNTQHFSWPTTHPSVDETQPESWPKIRGYEILGVLGWGGMGIVYKAEQHALSRWVALKKLHAGVADDPELQNRLRTEAKSLAQLQHPNVVHVYEVLEHAGTIILALELVEGGTLGQKLREETLSAAKAARTIEVLAQTMQRAHDLGIVHRDLKPSNVLLTPDGAPKIGDFGLARRLETSGDTLTGQIMGTPSYVPPEQARALDGWSTPLVDTYALGAILYECLTGRPPFRAESSMETLLQVVNDEPVPPSRLQRKIPRDLETICLKCLEKDPARRYESCAALAEDLKRFQAGEPIRARRISWAGRAMKWARRRPLVASLTAAVCLMLAFLLTIWLKHVHDLSHLNKELRAETNRANDNEREADVQKRRALVTLSQAGGALRQYHEQVQLDSKTNVPKLEAQEKLLKTLDGYAQVIARYDYPELRLEQARNYSTLGRITLKSRAYGKAAHYFQRAVQIRDGLERRQKRDPERCMELGFSLLGWGSALTHQEKHAQAETALLRAIRVLDASTPSLDTPEWILCYWRAQARYVLAGLRLRQDKHDEAKKLLLSAQNWIAHGQKNGPHLELKEFAKAVESMLELISARGSTGPSKD